jgi:hypothetical protein
MVFILSWTYTTNIINSTALNVLIKSFFPPIFVYFIKNITKIEDKTNGITGSVKINKKEYIQ